MTMYRRDYLADIKRVDVLEPVWSVYEYPEPEAAENSVNSGMTKLLEVRDVVSDLTRVKTCERHRRSDP